MQAVIPFLITIAVILIIVMIVNANRVKIDFYTKGMDSQFKTGEIRVLWNLAKKCGLDNPIALYYSVPTLNKCISMVITQSRHNGTENTQAMQNFLGRLYRFRTRVVLEGENKKGIQTTKALDEGQKVQVILKGRGVFYSKVISNARELVLAMPRSKSEKYISSSEWEGRKVSVYLWRKGDASYVFDTVVAKCGTFMNQSAVFLLHTNSLVRTQKRQSVRCDCHIYAQMYVIRNSIVDYDKKETSPGYKCLIENISEDGAMIRIGGKGVEDVQIKLQFKIDDVFIMMYGVVRSVEFNEAINQSRLHFECIHIEKGMKNTILSYVYDVIPTEEKEVDEAILEVEKAAIESGDADEEKGLLRTGSIYDEAEDAELAALEAAKAAIEDSKSEESKVPDLEQRSDSFENQVTSLEEEEKSDEENKNVAEEKTES